jgi:hypothetical protein
MLGIHRQQDDRSFVLDHPRKRQAVMFARGQLDIGDDDVDLVAVESVKGSHVFATFLSRRVLAGRPGSSAAPRCGHLGPANPNGDALTREVQGAARSLGLQLHVLNASTERDFDPAFATLTNVQAGGLVIATDGLFLAHGEQLGALVLRHRLPAIFAYHEFAAAGGLMSYGGSLTDQYRLLGVYAGRILKGEKPADLPVQQATKIELIINLKTAKALGLTFPETLLATADEVIE